MTKPQTARRLAVRGPETASMRTSDGVRLEADIYRPEGGGEYPVLLMRQPYGRRIASTVVFAHPSWYAANGYIVVVQDVRGRGGSEGRFRIFADDVVDGGETIAWAARLPGSTGRVGMYGFSYQGHTQFLALAAGRPELQALCPGMATWDLRSDWAYEGGAFSFANNLYWGVQMAAEQARLAGDVEAFEALHAASRALPLHSSIPCRPDVLETYARYSHYSQWIANSEPNAYWESVAVGAALQGKPMDVAMLHIGGWYDFMLRGTLRAFHEASARSRRPQRLVVGPWTHMPWGRRVGGVDFGAEAQGLVDPLQIAWFDRFLKDVDNGVDREPPVRLFDLVEKRWRDFDAWPRPKPRFFHLASNGLAATSQAGALTETSGRACDRRHRPRSLAACSLAGRPQRGTGRDAGEIRAGLPGRCSHLYVRAADVADQFGWRSRIVSRYPRRSTQLRRQRDPVVGDSRWTRVQPDPGPSPRRAGT